MNFKYALVEVMGRLKVVGEVSEEAIAGAALLRVDVPDTSRRKGFTRYFTAGALWGITPLVDEAEMRTLAEALDVVPVEGYSLRINSPQLMEKVRESGVIIHDEDDDPDDYAGFLDEELPGDDDLDDDEDETPSPDDEDEPEPDEPPLQSIVSMARGETANSRSPMWRCVTGHGEQVNVFKHADPKKDTFHLFEKAGYAPMMELMKVGDMLNWKEHPIHVRIERKDGWWNVIHVQQMPVGAKPELVYSDAPKMQAVRWAKELIDEDSFVVLDTETTGLNNLVKDEPVQICVLASDGTVLLDTLLKTEVQIERDAAAKHGITKEILAAAPSFAEVRDKLRAAIGDKRVIVYNADFDKGILRNANGDATWEFGDLWECAMEQYAQFWGDWSAFHGSYRWQPLTEACEQQGITGINSPAHSALGDCLRTLALIKKMAAYEEPTAHPF